MTIENHYAVLGLNTSASSDEIRRAYRILARRYHPDLNPGQPAAEERFKKISVAYETLSDPKKKRHYDAELEGFLNHDHQFGQAAFDRARRHTQRAHKRYAEAGRQSHRPGAKPTPPPTSESSWWKNTAERLSKTISGFSKEKESPSKRKKSFPPIRVSVIEASVSIHEAIHGGKKTIELEEPEGTRKLSVTIPPGVRSGSVIRLRNKGEGVEELIVIIRVAHHPFVAIQTRGLIVEVPITIQEAIQGANIIVPTLEEPISVKVPPGSSSGTEIRLPERGLNYRDGSRGDLFVRLMVSVPQSPDAVGLKDKAREIEPYYESSVRSKLPKSLA